jgi:hypothetical protein
MHAVFNMDGRSTTLVLEDMTPGQFMALHRALKLYAETSPVAGQVLEIIEDETPGVLLEQVRIA